MRAVQLDSRPARIDFLAEFGLTEEQKKEVFKERCFFVELYRGYYRQGTQCLNQLDFENEVARARATFLLMITKIVEDPRYTDEDYLNPKHRSTESSVFCASKTDTTKMIPRVHVCVEVLKSPAAEDSLFAGYRYWFFVLDSKFALLKGIENLMESNRKESTKRSRQQPSVCDLWRRVHDVRDLFNVIASMNPSIMTSAPQYQSLESLNPYKLCAPKKLMFYSDEKRSACLESNPKDPRTMISGVQSIYENYFNNDVLRFASLSDTYQINFLHVSANTMFDALMPGNPLPPWIRDSDEVTKNLRVNDARRSAQERSMDRDTSRVLESIKLNIADMLKKEGHEFRTKPSTYDEAFRAARTCGVEHVQRKLAWYDRRLNEENANLPAPQPGVPEPKPDVFKAAKIPIVDHTLDVLGNFFAQSFLWFDEKYAVKNMHKHIMMGFLTCLSCHDLSKRLGINLVVPGDAAKGKSFVIELLKRFTVDGTTEVFADVTPKVLNNADADYHSTTFLFHETLARFLGIDSEGKKDASEGDPVWKTLLAEGMLTILRSEEDPTTRKWVPVKITKHMKVSCVLNTNQPAHVMAGPITSRFIVAPCKDKERKYHAVSDMAAWQSATRNVDVDSKPVDNLFRKIDFLVFAVFLLIELGIVPPPELVVCDLAFNKFGERLRVEGIDATDARTFEIYRSICRVLTVLNAVLVEFCMTDTTEFDFPDLMRVVDRMVATEQVAVLAYTFLLPYKFHDFDEAKMFHALTEDNPKIKRRWSADLNRWEYNEKAFKKTPTGETDTNWIRVDVPSSGSAVHEFAKILHRAYRERKQIDISTHHIVGIINALKIRVFDSMAVVEYDQLASSFYVSRRWLERTLLPEYDQIHVACLDAIAHRHTIPKRLVTMYSMIDSDISKPQLLAVREMKPNGRDKIFSVPFHPEFVAGVQDMDDEEFARRLFANKHELPRVPDPNPTCAAFTALHCDPYPETHVAKYDEDQRDRDEIMKSGAADPNKRLIKASEVLSKRTKTDSTDA